MEQTLFSCAPTRVSTRSTPDKDHTNQPFIHHLDFYLPRISFSLARLRLGHDGIKHYISPDIYVFEPSRQSAEKASAVLTINRKTGDVATKLNTDILRTVRERTMENC
ncbi:unnamed protein product, partial [Tilletia controversa]